MAMTEYQEPAALQALPGDTIARKSMPLVPLQVFASQRCPHHKRPDPGHLAYEVRSVLGGRVWVCALTVEQYDRI